MRGAPCRDPRLLYSGSNNATESTNNPLPPHPTTLALIISTNFTLATLAARCSLQLRLPRHKLVELDPALCAGQRPQAQGVAHCHRCQQQNRYLRRQRQDGSLLLFVRARAGRRGDPGRQDGVALEQPERVGGRAKRQNRPHRRGLGRQQHFDSRWLGSVRGGGGEQNRTHTITLTSLRF